MIRVGPRIVVATNNPGKVREIGRILDGFDVTSLADYASNYASNYAANNPTNNPADYAPVEFPEEGGDYFENARVKAIVAARTIGALCVADDSGLEVEVLGGAPGVYSARYGGAGLDDRGRLEKLLSELDPYPSPRAARFFCVAAVATPDGRSELAQGVCAGEIRMAAEGEGGFGYDPIFQPEGHDRVMAQLERDEKDAVSHRGRAFRALVPRIEALLAE